MTRSIRAWFGLRIVVIRRIVKNAISGWRTLPVMCNFCCHPIDGESAEAMERMGWCPNCKRPFRVPIFRIPGWVAGTVVLLLIKWQVGV